MELYWKARHCPIITKSTLSLGNRPFCPITNLIPLREETRIAQLVQEPSGRLLYGFGYPLNDMRRDLARSWRSRWWLKAAYVGLYRGRIPQEQFAEANGYKSSQNISAQLPFHTLLG